jgi:hypothetical protein
LEEKIVKSVFLRYHGCFLASLIDNSPFPVEVSREFPDDNHLYVFNKKVGAYVTYNSKRMSPWTFSFEPKHVHSILELFDRHEDAFVILVCGFETTAVLDKAEVVKLLPRESSSNSSITIRTGHDRKLAVSGTCGELKGKVAKTRTYERLLSVMNK